MTSIPRLYEIFKQFPSVCTDSRHLKTGDIFFALKGGNFNGNLFALKALESGASHAVIDEPVDNTGTAADYGDRFLRVPDVLATLQGLAGHHRDQFDIPFLGITGSNGKTTTKELIHAVLSQKFRTYTTEGNLNNHIGIPLTLLKIGSDAEMAVVEMGANHLLEIAGYCAYTRPTDGIITNCGKAHLEGFGSPEGVRKGKGELYDWLRAHGGSAYVMWDYDYLRAMSKGIARLVTYGISGAAVNGHIVERNPFVTIEVEGSGLVRTKLAGDYNLPNILAAICVGKTFGVPFDQMRDAIEAYQPSNSRSQMLTRGSNRIILDAYNANPSSMRAAIENLAAFPDKRKILILGAMAELGPDSVPEHEQIVQLIEKYPWDAVALVGGDFLHVKHPYLSLADAHTARQWFVSQAIHDSVILIKGSRSMKMETILN